MSIRFRQTILMLGVAAPVAMGVATPASAFSLGKLTKGISHAVQGAAKDVGRTVNRATKPVGRAVGSATRDIGHAASSVTRDVEHAAATVSRDVRHEIPNLGRDYMNVARPVGRAVSKYYDEAGKVAKYVPGVGPAGEALAKEASQIAKSKEAQIGAGIATGTALLGAGTGALSYIGTAAGQGGVGAYYSKKIYDAGRREVKNTARDIRASVKNLPR